MLFRYFQYAVWVVAAVVSCGAARGTAAEIIPAAGEVADVLRSAETEQAIAYRFSDDDVELLDSIQEGCFRFFWNEVGETGLVKDRRTTIVSSLAGVGFQLSSLPIGVERKWITREQGEQRALKILRSLTARNDNRHAGVFLHFVHRDTGGVYPKFRNEASTVDHSLLLAGALPAASYFGGEVAEIIDRLVAESNWKAFASPETGLLSFAWKPDDNRSMNGDGAFMPNQWHLASDEERLIYFMAVGCPTPEFAIEPRQYYQLKRHVDRHQDMLPYVVSWNGALFTYFFSHCWIDYRSLTADDPAAFGGAGPRVDWFENSRRATLTHRQRCIEASEEFATFAPDRWGVSPCMGLNEEGRASYLVQDVRPNLSRNDNWQGGTVAPYAAGSAIIFTPAESMAALRAFRELQTPAGEWLAWRDPAGGGYGLADSINLDQQHASDDYVSIDMGPMLLAIENVRTGLIWRLFKQHKIAQQTTERLGLGL